MAVRIQFDKPNAWHFTNLDFVTGRVILTLPTDATISAITVKLEGESRTKLAGPKTPQDERRRRTELEVHKLLYKVQTVFPTLQMQEVSPGGSSQYSLLAGQYDYPFSFKFPFNNSCRENTSLLRDLKLGSLNVPIAPDTNQHLKRALPPTLSGFPGEAEIKYYVKATIVRPKFYQENVRYKKQVDIKFFPIESPRPPHNQEETYARRKHQFQKAHPQPAKKGLFRKSSVPDPDEEPTVFQVDARLPNPAIITCNEPLPLRILVRRLDNASTSVYLSMLQIELIAFTQIRAHDLNRTELTSWTIMSQANMNMPLGTPTDKEPMEWKIPSRLWDNAPLPNTVAPTFETCNISRKYELEVRVGLTHGMATGVRPELIVMPLRLPVKVFSGIAPPASLLNALANQPAPSHPLSDSTISDSTTFGYDQPPPTPASPGASDQNFPVRFGSVSQPVNPDEPPPPSYEDAMAEDIGPLDGPRRDYNPPSDPPTSPGGSSNSFASDSKSGGLRRHVSERLFPQNAPRRPEEAEPMRESNLHDSMTVPEDIEAPRSIADGVEIAPPKPPRRRDTRSSIREV